MSKWSERQIFGGILIFCIILELFLCGTPPFSSWKFIYEYNSPRNKGKECVAEEKEYGACDSGLFHYCVKSGYDMGTKVGILRCIRDLCSFEAVDNKEEYWKCAAKYR